MSNEDDKMNASFSNDFVHEVMSLTIDEESRVNVHKRKPIKEKTEDFETTIDQ